MDTDKQKLQGHFAKYVTLTQAALTKCILPHVPSEEINALKVSQGLDNVSMGGLTPEISLFLMLPEEKTRQHTHQYLYRDLQVQMF